MIKRIALHDCTGQCPQMIVRTEAEVAAGDGILLLKDPTTASEGPPNREASAVVATNACVSLWTRQAMAGPVTVVLTDESQDYDGGPVFRGTLQTPGRRLAFVSSDGKLLLEAQVKNTSTFVMILANDRKSPSKLVCVVEDHSIDAGDVLETLGCLLPNPFWKMH